MTEKSIGNGLLTVRLVLSFILAVFLFIFAYLSYAYSLVFVIIAAACVWAFYLILSPRKLFAAYPLLVVTARIIGLDYDKFRQSVVESNNARVLKNIVGKTGGKINKTGKQASGVLLLLPHCLQNSACLYKVTWDKLENCRRCGECTIPQFIDIKAQYKVDVVMVGGGTAARQVVKEKHPGFIIAVACENDLISGLSDVKNIPVIGVLNQRKCDPCKDTSVNVDDIKRYLNLFLD